MLTEKQINEIAKFLYLKNISRVFSTTNTIEDSSEYVVEVDLYIRLLWIC